MGTPSLPVFPGWGKPREIVRPGIDSPPIRGSLPMVKPPAHQHLFDVGGVPVTIRTIEPDEGTIALGKGIPQR